MFLGIGINKPSTAPAVSPSRAAHIASTGLSENAFLMFFFAAFAFAAALGFAWYARRYPMQDNYRAA